MRSPPTYLEPDSLGSEGFVRRDESAGHFGDDEGDGGVVQDGLESEMEAVLQSALHTEGKVAGGLQVAFQQD